MKDPKLNIISTINFIIHLSFGLAILLLLLLVAMQKWIPVLIFIVTIVFTVVFALYRKKPEVLIVIGLLLNFVPHCLKVGYTIIIVTFMLTIIERYVKEHKKIKLDIVKIAWSAIVLLGLITIPKWNLIWVGIQYYAALSIIPLMIYILITDEYISETGSRWILKTGIPIIAGVILLETLMALISILLSQEATVGFVNINIFRTIEIPENGTNRLAGMLMFLSIHLFLTRSKWKGGWAKNIILTLGMSLTFIISFLFTSRGALICLFVAIVAYVVGKYLLEKRVNWLTIVLPLLPVIIILKPFVERLLYRMQNVKTDWSTLARLVLWKDCISHIKNGLIIGTGPAQYIYRSFSEVLIDPHNMFLRYGLEFGAISIILLLIILSYPIILVLKGFKINRALSMSIFIMFAPQLLGTITHSQIDSTITSRSSGLLIWLVWTLFVNKLINLKTQVKSIQ